MSLITREHHLGNNIEIIAICVTTPVLKLILTCFKNYRLKNDISMTQRLKQTVVNGVSNIQDYIIILATTLAILVVLLLHLWMVKIDTEQNEEQDTFESISSFSMVLFLFLLTVIHLIPFFKSCALRFISTFSCGFLLNLFSHII